MLRTTAVLFLVFFSVVLAGQDTVNFTDAAGRRQGFWRKIDSAGKVVYEGRFADGIRQGEFRYFYPDGKLKAVSVVSGNGKKSETVSYFPNGKKMASGSYLEGKKDGAWKFFRETDGTLVSEETYVAGEVNGLSKVYYSEGRLAEQHYYRKGKKDGLWEQYFIDGRLKLRGAFRAGEQQGEMMLYYNSGRPMIEGSYSGGHQEGTWIYYAEDGNTSKIEIYSKGILLRTDPPEPK